MELHLIGTHYLCTKLCYYLTINEYHSCLYELVSLTARAYSGVGQELVQTYRLVRVYVCLLILDTLLHAVLGIWIIAWCALSVTATLLVATLTLLSVAATLLIATLALLSVTTLTLLSVTALTLLSVSALALLSVAALAWLETTTWLIATLTWLIAAILFTIVVIPGLIAVCPRTWLISFVALIAMLLSVATLTLLVGAWLIRALLLLSASTLQGSTKAFWPEAAFILSTALVGCVSALRVNAWTLWSSSCTIISLIICGSVAFTAVVTLLCRGVQRFVLHF